MKKQILLIFLLFSVLFGNTQPGHLTLKLERIDPITSKPQFVTEQVASNKTAIIVMDMWDKHWCKSWTARDIAMIPQMNRVLAEARRRGVQVIFSPSVVADFYKDYPQRKAVTSLPEYREFIYPSVEELQDLEDKRQLDTKKYTRKYFAGTIFEARDFPGATYKGYPPFPPFAKTGGCECAERDCKEATVWTRQNKDVLIESGDLITEGNNRSELVRICKARGFTHLLYMGGAGNMCLTVSRENSTMNMMNRGLKCVYLEDLMISISGRGYNPDTKLNDPGFTPEKGDSLVLVHLKKYVAPAAKTYEVFPDAQDEVMSYVPKGPADCFRQICFDINEKEVYPDSILNTFFSAQDPVAYAAFCKKINLDAALLLAVPQAGYATYRKTIVNTPYPGMKGDFFGETLQELHKLGISGFGYIGIGWIMKYAKEHPEYAEHTEGDKAHPLICLNSPYRERVMEASREILKNYPIDGLRYDILDQPASCRCDGCKNLYREMFQAAMPAEWLDWQHREKFRIESIRHIVKDLYAVCKSIKPTVPVWQNWFSGQDAADISDANFVDMSYIEFADPFRELLLNGVFQKRGIITGKVIENQKMAWECLALGGRCYSYFASVGKTGLPDSDTSFDRIVPVDWFEKELAPFYAQVKMVEPYLANTSPVTNIAILYNESTRYHYEQYNRDDYMNILRGITEPILQSGNPVRFISNVNLSSTSLDAYKAIIIPESSGFSEDQLAIINGYVQKGGQILVTGDALCYSADGQRLQDFALGEIMGVSLKRSPELIKQAGVISVDTLRQATALEVIRNGRLPAKLYTSDRPFTVVTIKKGQTISFIKSPAGERQPLVQVNKIGKGAVYYLASSSMPELTAAVLNHAGVTSPVKNNNSTVFAVLTRKNDAPEWILHLVSKGQYSLVINKKFCPATKITATYPADLKNIDVQYGKDSIRINVSTENTYSTIVLR